MKCRYKNCRCSEDENLIKIKNSYWHEECQKEFQNIKAIISLFQNEINSNVVISELGRVINTIIYNKGVSSDFLLFALQYYIDNKLPLNYPQGLFYVAQNTKAQDEWAKRNKETAPKIEFKVSEDIEIEPEFKYKTQKTKKIGDIFNE